MYTKIFRILSFVFVMALSSASLVNAAEGACKEDIKRLCPDAELKGDQAKACLKENVDDLSLECKENIRKLIGALQSFGEACGADVKTLCTDVTPGGGRILKCLKDNHESVSAGCIDFLTP